MFTTVGQVKQVIQGYMQNSGRGGFLTGVVKSVAPLAIEAEKMTLTEESLYITDSCIGLIMHYRHDHTDSMGGKTDKQLQDDVILREPFKPGDGVLLLARPDTVDGVKYIVLDRIQPYQEKREVSAK